MSRFVCWVDVRAALAATLMLVSVAFPEPSVAATSSKSQQRPNVIVIVADDLGYADVSAYQKGRIPTPNIDRLGRSGVTFRQGYVAAPICSPSRAALMTGRYQQRYGFEYNNGPARRDVDEHLGLDPRERTLGEAMKSGGYSTAAIGKWHLGSNDEHYPTRRGFDYWWGFLTGQTNFIDPNSPEAINGEPPVERGLNPKTATGGEGDISAPTPKRGALVSIYTGPDRQRVDNESKYLVEEITAQANAFIDANKTRPFFLYVAHNAPHTPLQTTKKYWDRFPSIVDRRARVYASMVSALDDSVGQILDKLDQTGLADSTMVVFLSDNGCAGYLAGLCSCEPLTGSKLTQFEGGVRVPFMIRMPGRIPAGKVIDQPVSSLDIFPTALALAGIAPPKDRPLDGVNLLPLAARGAKLAPRPLFWRTKPMIAARDADWKYMRDLDNREHLYRLSSDPKERDNLAAKLPAQTARLRALAAKWEKDKAEPGWGGRHSEFKMCGLDFKFTP